MQLLNRRAGRLATATHEPTQCFLGSSQQTQQLAYEALVALVLMRTFTDLYHTMGCCCRGHNRMRPVFGTGLICALGLLNLCVLWIFLHGFCCALIFFFFFFFCMVCDGRYWRRSIPYTATHHGYAAVCARVVGFPMPLLRWNNSCCSTALCATDLNGGPRDTRSIYSTPYKTQQ